MAIVFKSGSLNLLEPRKPVQACTLIALPCNTLYYTTLYYTVNLKLVTSFAAVDLRYIASAIPTLTGRKQFGRRNWTALLSRGLQKARTKPTPVLISPSPSCGGIFVHEMEPSHIPSCVTTRRQLSCAGHDQSQRRATQPRTEIEERRVHGLSISTFCCIIFFKPAYMCCPVLNAYMQPNSELTRTSLDEALVCRGTSLHVSLYTFRSPRIYWRSLQFYPHSGLIYVLYIIVWLRCFKLTARCIV